MKRAFTFIEVMIVIVIIGLIAAMICGFFGGAGIRVGDRVIFHGKPYTVTAISGYKGNPQRNTAMSFACNLCIADDDGHSLTVSDSIVEKVGGAR